MGSISQGGLGFGDAGIWAKLAEGMSRGHVALLPPLTTPKGPASLVPRAVQAPLLGGGWDSGAWLHFTTWEGWSTLLVPGPKLDIAKVHTNWVLAVAGPGSRSPSQPSLLRTQDGTDKATAGVTKQVLESQGQSIPLAPECRMDHQEPGQSPHGGAEGSERVCAQAAGGGREGEWVGSRHG